MSEVIDFNTLLGGERVEEREETVARAAATVSLQPTLRHLSASSIGMLLRCPRQFQRRYVFGEKERPGESMLIGSYLHTTLNWNYAQKISSGEDVPLATAMEYFNDHAVPKVNEQEGGIENVKWDSSPEDARSDGERITAAYYKAVVPRIQPVATEQKFTLQIPEVEVPVIGFIDVQEEGRVIDTKTGKQVQSKVKPSWMLQGRTYSYATGLPTEYHSISRAKTPGIKTGLESEDLIVPVPTEAQMHEFVRLVQTAAHLLRVFIRDYGTHEQDWPTWGAVPDFTRNMLPCNFCGWRQGCPAWA